MDTFSLGLLVGIGLSLITWSVVALTRRWQAGDSRDTLPNNAVSTSSPDLTIAMLDHLLEDAASKVVDHGLDMASLAAGFSPDANWQLDLPRSAAMPVHQEFFLEMERLAIAVRARRGEKLTDTELGVLYGVLKPTRFRTEPAPQNLLEAGA